MTDPKTGERKRLQPSGTGFRTKREAQAAERAERTKLDRGAYVKPSNVILADCAVKWLQRRKATGKGLKDTMLGPYERYVQDIKNSWLGRMKLTDI